MAVTSSNDLKTFETWLSKSSTHSWDKTTKKVYSRQGKVDAIVYVCQRGVETFSLCFNKDTGSLISMT